MNPSQKNLAKFLANRFAKPSAARISPIFRLAVALFVILFVWGGGAT